MAVRDALAARRRFARKTLERAQSRAGVPPAQRPHQREPQKANRGFTLVESIVVGALVAIMVAAVVPSVIRRNDRAVWTAETANLNNIADGLTQSILRTKTIPNYTNWASAVASQMSLPLSVVSTNARCYARAFLIDTNLNINGAGLPYTQTTNGTTKPNSARVMIVSSLARALPANITNGIPTSAEFNAIWDTAEGAKPSPPATTNWNGWAGTGDDLRIKRINLEPLFYQLILCNHDPSAVGKFSIDGSSVINVPTTNSPAGWNKYYLDGTVLGLHDASGQVQSRHVLKRNISFLFESGTWRGLIQGDQQSFGSSGADFFNHAITFFNRPNNPWSGSSAHGASQYGVMISMYTFMFDYTYWANECPHFDYHNNNITAVPEYVLLNNQGQNNGTVDQFSSALLTLPPKK